MEYQQIRLRLPPETDIIDIDKDRIEPPDGSLQLAIQANGQFKDLGWNLTRTYDWAFGLDEENNLVLVRLKKWTR